MLPTSLDDLASEHILSLFQNETPERKTLDYKHKLPSGGDETKKEFLSDVTSFANASGGDLVFGIAERRSAENQPTGLPGEIHDLGLTNPGSDCARLENMIRDGIQPRIPGVQVKTIAVDGQGCVLVVRIPRSWIGPHMVTFGNASRFYSRNSSAGKYQLDVHQIAEAFTTQRTLGERLRNWRADRIGKALADEGPISLEGPCLLLHFVSAAALDSEIGTVDVRLPRDASNLLQPMSLSSWGGWRYNADGFLVNSNRTQNGTQSYVQVFRSGILEYGDSYVMQNRHENLIPSSIVERKIVEVFGRGLRTIRELAVSDPVFFSAALLRVKGLSMALPQERRMWAHEQHPFDRDVVMSPDVPVENTQEGEPYPTSVLPVVNWIWQASGYERTPNIGQDGRWKVP